jgi:DNA repair photolyase
MAKPFIREIKASTILTPQKMGSLVNHYEYSLNPYAGCAFACSYCYVPKFPNAEHQSFEWGKWVNVKINAADLIYKERQKVFNSRIFFSSATDPYQYLELKYRLTRACLQELLKYSPALITMHTRSHLALQDIELFKKFGKRLRFGVSFTTDSDDIAREFEPKAPSIKKRLQLLKGLKEAGISCHASLAPLLPCDPERLAAILKPYVEHIWIDEMNYPEINNKPELLQKYKGFFETKSYRRTIESIRKSFQRPRSLSRNTAIKSIDRQRAQTDGATALQLSLF